MRKSMPGILIAIFAFGVSLYTSMALTPWMLLLSVAIVISLIGGARYRLYLLFQIASGLLVVNGLIYFYVLPGNYIFAVLLGVIIFLILETGYFLVTVNFEAFKLKRDWQRLKKLFLWPNALRVLVSIVITIVLTFLFVNMTMPFQFVLISPLVDIFLLTALLVVVLFLMKIQLQNTHT